MKRILIFTLLMVFAVMPNLFADDISVYINGEEKSFYPAPQIVEDRTIVPMRAFFESLGAKVTWEENTRTVIGTKGGTVVILQIDNQTAIVNGAERQLEVPAKIIEGRTFIPLRFVGEALGENVSWENASKTISIIPKLINQGNPQTPANPGGTGGSGSSGNTGNSGSGGNTDNPSTPTQGLSAFEAEVVELVNAERAKAGLQPLKANVELSKVARLKSEDMRDKNYFAHNSPTYGSPFDMMKQFGISYRTAGENLAAGQATPEQVVNSWMNSPGHRANILNSSYTDIGVGYAQGGSYRHYWTQMFIATGSNSGSASSGNTGSSTNPGDSNNNTSDQGSSNGSSNSGSNVNDSNNNPGNTGGSGSSGNTGNSGSSGNTTNPSTPTQGLSAFEAKVVELVNAERAKVGLKPLKANVELSKVARLKSEDMRDKNYFAHNSPTYGSPFDMMKRFGISYRTAGENIAAGQSTPEQVVNSWMNSPGHRANIMSNSFTEIGVGYAQGGSYRHYWTQLFITP